MNVYKDGKFKIEKDGTSYYRVYEGRKRIGSFLFLSEGKNYIELKKNLELENNKIVQCLNCGEKQELKENEIYQDIKGKFIVCKNCDSSFDVEI
jgi:hypothetical protein